MSDRDLRVEPTPAVRAPAPVQPVQHEASVVARIEHKSAAPQPGDIGAATGGNLRAAYAQYAINPDTHDVIIRIRDLATDQVISETPSKEVQAMTKYLTDYAATIVRHRAANLSAAAN